MGHTYRQPSATAPAVEVIEAEAGMPIFGIAFTIIGDCPYSAQEEPAVAVAAPEALGWQSIEHNPPSRNPNLHARRINKDRRFYLPPSVHETK